jgi:hypothetical protein
LPLDVIQVISHGVGRSAEEAIQDALQSALVRAVSAQAEAASWAQSNPALCKIVLSDAGDLVLRWRELASSKEWRLKGTLYHRELAVEVDRNALLGRIHAAGGPSLSRSALPAGQYGTAP